MIIIVSDVLQMDVEKGITLAEKIDSREVVNIEETLKTEIYINQALIDLLVEKGVLKHDKILEKIKKLRVEEKQR